MSDSSLRLPARPSLEQLRKQAKELLKAVRAGDEAARARFAKAGRQGPALLATAQHVLALECGFENWINLRRYVEATRPSRIDRYAMMAEDVVLACQTGDAGAIERLGEFFGGRLTVESIRNRVRLRLNTVGETIALAEGRLFVARAYGFEGWEAFQESVMQPRKRAATIHGLSSTPPFYKIDQKDRSIEPWPPLSLNEWGEIFDVMRQRRITRLRAAGQMTDAALEHLAASGSVTSLELQGSRHVTDVGIKHLARMPGLERLNLSGCSITDRGLAILRELPELREFYLYHHGGVSDAGAASLAFCEKLERVDLLGSATGDGAIRALAGKRNLRHFKSGTEVSDRGLPLLHEIPRFKKWHGGDPEFSLMSFHAEPNHLLLRGQITDKGMASLVGLDGLFSLNLDDAKLSITAAGLRPLLSLPNLCCLGFDAKDETMGAIAELPRLRMLMCQDTSAGDHGFMQLSRSRTLEYIWGRRCYNLAGVGFRALSKMPSLRGLSVSCRNVDDASLASLPDFPALVEFMPMDVSDEGFRHVGRCARLEGVWCMYCRDTGDAATEHLTGLERLKVYYAGETRITDRSLELLGRMRSIERLTLAACAGVTNVGVAALAHLPLLKELTLELLPAVTRDAVRLIPARVRVSFES